MISINQSTCLQTERPTVDASLKHPLIQLVFCVSPCQLKFNSTQMPYIIIRGNLASYSHKYPWRVLVSGLKGKSLTMYLLLTIFIWLSNCFDVGLSFFYLSTFIYVEKKNHLLRTFECTLFLPCQSFTMFHRYCTIGIMMMTFLVPMLNNFYLYVHYIPHFQDLCECEPPSITLVDCMMHYND